MLTITMLIQGAPVFAQSSPDTPGAAAPVTSRPVQSRGVVVLRAAPVADPAPAPTPVADTPVRPPPPPAPLAIFKSCPRPFGGDAIAVTAASPETERFNAALRARLTRRQASVVVDMAAPFAVDSAAPPELSAWLTQVKATKGTVTMRQYCQESRGFMAFFGKMFSGARVSRYAAADGYDAVLHVDGLDQRVTQVEFRLRGTH